MRDMFMKTLIEIARVDKNVHLITGDLGYGVLRPFWEEFPRQFINAGISEQSMTGIAAGMALEGKIVFTYSIGNFPTLRCAEQIRNDCAYHNTNVKIVCIGGGFVYGPLGMSHHATEDLAIMRALPGVTVMAPSDSAEAKCATKAIYNHQGTCYLRLSKGGEKIIHDEIDNFVIGKAIKIRDGEKVAVFTTGAIFDEILEASKMLDEAGIHPALYTFPTIKPIDTDTIQDCAKKFKLIVTIEEHNIIGGFGSAVAEELVEMHGNKASMLKLGINDRYSSIVGSQQYLRDFFGLSARKITNTISQAYDKILSQSVTQINSSIVL